LEQLAADTAIAYETDMTGAEMREFREKLGWSQQRLATALGMSVSRIVDYERGTTRGVGKPVTIPRVVELACEMLLVKHERGEI
jgi:transcriptional regulator with XRE-family HTH domain